MIENEIEISPAQIKALCSIFCGNENKRNITVTQTFTKQGGTHLYVKGDGRHFHISAAGRAQELDVPLPDHTIVHQGGFMNTIKKLGMRIMGKEIPEEAAKPSKDGKWC